MNSVKFKKLCFGALLKPGCWGCAAFNHQVVGGWIAVILFALVGRFYVAAGVALFVVLFMMHLIVSPVAQYKIQMSDKVLFVLLFHSDFYRKYKTDLCRKMSLVRIIALHADGQTEIIWKGREVFGCDVRFIKSGLFLFKPRLAFWAVISDGFEYGKDLGRRIGDLVFDEKTSLNKRTLHFLMNNTCFALTVDAYNRDLIFTYFHQAVVFKPLNSDELSHIVVGTALQHLVCTIDGKDYLIGYHISDMGVPMAYLIIASTFIWKHNGKDVILHADENGAFKMPLH